MQYNKLGSNRAGQVREKLRILGRIKIMLRSLTGESSAEIGHFITPRKFDTCIQAVQKCAEINNDRTSLSGTSVYEKPSFAVKAGPL